jgi:uncharacterized membrane protein
MTTTELCLALEAAALSYLIVTSCLGAGALADLVADNVARGFRRWLLAVPPVVGGAVFCWLHLAARGGRLLGGAGPRIARVGTPLLVAWALPALLIKRTPATDELFFAGVVGCVALASEWSLREARSGLGELLARGDVVFRKLPRWAPAALAGGLVLVAWGLGCFASLRVHDKMLTSNFDLGIFENVFFNTLHGAPGRGLGRAYFAEHAEFLLFALLPLYALVPRAETLLVIQATLLAGAGVPLFLLAHRWLRSGWQACALVAIYLSLPALHGALLYDFHFLPLSVFFLFWAAYFRALRASIPFWIAVVLALCCREDVALGVAAIGVGLLGVGRERRTAVALAVLGSVWFVLVKFVWMRRFGEETFTAYYEALIPHGERGFIGVLKTALSNPLYTLQKTLTEDKLLFALHAFAPLAFFPLRQKRTLPLLLPGLLVIGLSTSRSAVSQIHFHYAMHVVPYALLATVIGLAARPRAVRAPAILAMLVATGVSSVHFGAFLGGTFRTSFHEVSFGWDSSDARRQRAFRALAARIPKDASVAAGEYEGSHLAARKELFAVKEGLGTATYVIYSARSLRWGGREAIQEALRARTHGVVKRQDDLTLLERGADTRDNAEALRKL